MSSIGFCKSVASITARVGRAPISTKVSPLQHMAATSDVDCLVPRRPHGIADVLETVCALGGTSWWDVGAMQQGPQPSALFKRLPTGLPTTAQLFMTTLKREAGFTQTADGRLALAPASREVLAEIEADPRLRTVLRHCIDTCQDDPGHDVSHFIRVAQGALCLASGHGLVRSHVISAALLHDIFNPPKNDPRSPMSSIISADMARHILQPLDVCSPGELDTICQAIVTHSNSARRQPTSILGCVLQDADRLDALGAVGLMRLFAVGQRMGSAWFDPADPWAQRRALAGKQYNLDHLQKLYTLAGTMTTASGRASGEVRTAFMKRMVDALAKDLGLPSCPYTIQSAPGATGPKPAAPAVRGVRLARASLG